MSKKVLMLHGYAQSDSIFYGKTGGFRKNLSKLGYELYYPCAPAKVPGIDISNEDDFASVYNTTAGTSDIYGWWLKHPDDQYKVPQETADYLRDYIIENGPFHGIVGFSQGAGYGGYLCTDIRGLLNLSLDEQPDLEFFISFSGFRLQPEWFQEQYDKHEITVPSLHVQGELDTVVEEQRVLSLYYSCSNDTKTMLKHPGGHFVPNSKSFVNKVINWLQVVAKPETEQIKHGPSQPKSFNEPQLDDDLLSVIDGMGKI